MVSHAIVVDYNNNLSEWEQTSQLIKQHPEIIGVAPYIEAEGMLVFNKKVKGTAIQGILPEWEDEVSVVSEKIISGNYNDLQAGGFGVVIGSELARLLGVIVGEKVTVVAPNANATPAGILPRLKQFEVKGIFEIGMHEYDSALVLMHMDDAGRLFRKAGPDALRIKTMDLIRAPLISREVMQQIPGTYGIIDWTQQHANFFRALKTEKTVMFVILTLIVAVAAFNIISTLVMMVTDKQTDIAVLRTIGSSPLSIMSIFMIQGTIIGIAGIILGVISGVWLALNVETLVSAIESVLGIKFLSPDVYYISDLPSELHWADVLVISLVSFFFSIIATVFPAWRAAHIQPAEALRYE